MKGIMDKHLEMEHLAEDLEHIAFRLRKIICVDNMLEEGVRINVVASVRFPEDASVDGVQETAETPRMPHLLKVGSGYDWNITIDSKSGIIEDWPQGVSAKTWYKVCDMCRITIAGQVHYNGYVPSFLALDDEGYGEYLYLTIDGMGKVEKWDEKTVIDWVKDQK